MCVLVHRSTRVIQPWDPDQRTITIPDGLHPRLATLAIRAVLLELHIEQPESGAVCWCGAPVEAPHTLIPIQRRPSEVMPHGA